MPLPSHIVITGASGGIGRETALALAEAGATLHLGGRNEATLKAAIEAVEQRGGSCFGYRHDLSAESGRQAFCRELGEKAPAIDWVIQAAGMIDPREPDEPLDGAAAAEVFAINALAPLSLTRLLSPLMRKEGGMIYVASTSALWGNERFPIYSASKAALVAFARGMAKRWNTDGPLSMVICPGPTDTAMTRAIGTDPEKTQPAAAVAKTIRAIIGGESPYKSGDVVIVRGGEESLYAA